MPRYRQLDYYLRSIVAAVLSLGIVGAVIYEQLHGGKIDGTLGVWAGTVLGFYFGSHVAFNGSALRVRATDPPPPETPPASLP